jgi:hypothetical protein
MLEQNILFIAFVVLSFPLGCMAGYAMRKFDETPKQENTEIYADQGKNIARFDAFEKKCKQLVRDDMEEVIGLHGVGE